ncbi:L-glutamate gamma-semialdehyde dehydrogenase [Nocardia caishijiensis]|uniref:L-glutamate gamma-semialdehyde dehydrogenase n=1 Tax=Nocardia caishijiensis TaxID=184756 RepID=A0ABQ6YI98_9NOCA|nr:L-glutamate gamma-semialdehyde dehydrogenase [Nocardia caishijiensis]KAF0845515.1 delta-1-pyrroline-5-carboxylate dehydrogenase [Nocardia caishijiensis]
MDVIATTPPPVNEPVGTFAPGTPERTRLQTALTDLAAAPTEICHVIGGRHLRGDGPAFEVVQPHRHRAVLGTLHDATATETAAAVGAATEAAPAWRAMSFDDRASVFLRAADLLAGPWREKICAATMLGQSKSPYQAEIDAPCELVDFWRFNVSFARQIIAEQPLSSRGVWNRMQYRSLEGFVYAVTPFNFTAIAGNLPTAPALMGNTVVWKPSRSQAVAAYLTMCLLEEAGLPPGVINLVHGAGPEVSDVVLPDPRLAGVHFTGSTATFQHLWRTVATNLERYRTYPRLVGETGGKDFVLAHPSADPAVLTTALLRGAFDYQGQKCSAASRAYVPRSVWSVMSEDLIEKTASLRYGDVTDFANFGGALIDRRAFDRNTAALERAKATQGITVVAGGHSDDSVGWFVEPTVLVGDDAGDEIFHTEYFGPILAVHVYDDSTPSGFEEAMHLVDAGAYGLTGSIIAQDRTAIAAATERLTFSAGNFYINDKPSGAVVGQQPFGGGRASGTNDKAGSAQNLLRWTSARTIKETFTPPTEHGYPHQESEAN